MEKKYIFSEHNTVNFSNIYGTSLYIMSGEAAEILVKSEIDDDLIIQNQIPGWLK